MCPRQVDAERVAEVEASIIEAARDLIADGGLDGLSMRHVAERVGTSATAIYHYFDNKEALVQRVLVLAFQRFGEYLEDAAQRHPVGSLERLYALGEGYLRFALENQAYFRVLFSLQTDPKTVEDLPHGGGYLLLRESVVQAIAAGNLRDADPDLLSLYLWCVAHGVITISLACRIDECSGSSLSTLPATPPELYAAFRPFIRDGIRARAGAKREADAIAVEAGER